MASNSRLALSVLLVLCFVQAAMLVRAKKGEGEADLTVINGLAVPLDLECPPETDPGNLLNPGEEFTWKSFANDRWRCQVSGNEKVFSKLYVFDPKRDAGKASVFWNVKDDGLYLSYDKQKWEKKYDW